MLATLPRYCIDTSSVILWFVDVYPPSIFPGLVTRVESLIAAERLRSPKVVLDEIRPGDDCHTWAKGQEADLFVEESADVQQLVRRLMATHHDPARPLKGINGADPFVIAMAGVTGSGSARERPESAQWRRSRPGAAWAAF